MPDSNNDLVIQWIKEATKELRELRDDNSKDHKDLTRMIAKNREEFVIFKTKVSTRTAMISAGIGFVALVFSIILNFGSIRERAAAKDVEHTHPTTEQPIVE